MIAGSHTTSSFIQFLCIVLAAFPEVHQKVQEEIDRVVGSERMPELDDFKNLPYLQAVINEVCRCPFYGCRGCRLTFS
jgi:cytochrome P450